MAASPPMQQVLNTSAAPAEVERYLAGLNVPGWARSGSPTGSLIWSHKYISNVILIVGIVLLLTTLIGGLVLFLRDTELLVVTMSPLNSGGTKIVVAGAADVAMSSSLFQMLNQLPPEARAPA